MRVILLRAAFFSFAFVVGASGLSAADSPATVSGRIVERAIKTSPGQELTVQLDTGGRLQIRGTDGDTVHLRAHLPRKSWRNFIVNFDASGGGVRLHAAAVDDSYSTYGADFELLVPRRYSVSLQSAGGQLDISGVEGRISGKILGGMITIAHARGRAELATTGGAVHVSDSDLSGFITTGGGSVKLRRVTGGVHAGYGSGSGGQL